MSRTAGEKPEGYWGELVLFGGFVGAVAAPLKFLVHHVLVWTGLAKPFYAKLTAYLSPGTTIRKDSGSSSSAR